MRDVDVSGLSRSEVIELQRREDDEHCNREEKALKRHLKEMALAREHVDRELLCMIGSSEFRANSRVMHPVLRLKGVVPFVDFDDGDRERVMEMPNSVGFTADEAVRVHTGSDASKHSVLPSLDGKHVRVRTSRGWVSYRRQYFYVLLIRKIASIMESGGYTGAVWQDLEEADPDGEKMGEFKRAVDAVLDASVSDLHRSVVERQGSIDAHTPKTRASMKSTCSSVG